MGSSVVFLFNTGASDITKINDKYAKLNSNIADVYKSQIEKFLNTWLIFSCRCTECHCFKTNNDTYLIDKTNLSNIEFSFSRIFGTTYFNNIFKYILPRLLRFRHILKYEDIKGFEQAFKTIKDKEGKCFNKVLSKCDKNSILMSYRRIYDFYESVIDWTNEALTFKFNTIINELSKTYLKNDNFENQLLGFIEEDIFYNNSAYSDLREKSLVLFFELVCRYFENINLMPCETNTPTSKYASEFYHFQKVVISNGIMYAFLKDSKNIMIYDFKDKIRNEEKELRKNILDYPELFEKYKLRIIDHVRRIYLLSLESDLVNMVYSEDNIILFLSDGSVIANGSNNNHKLSSKNQSEYIRFVHFDTSFYKEIKTIQIEKAHIYTIANDTNLFIHGDLDETFAIKASECNELKKNIYVKEIEKDYYIEFSPDEKYMVYHHNKDLGNNFLTDSYCLNRIDDKTIVLKQLDTDDILHSYDFAEISMNGSITNIFELKKDAFIIEYTIAEENNEISYRYFIIGYDDNNNDRLGYTPNEEENNLGKLHEITDAFYASSDGIKTKKIVKVISMEERTFILMNDKGLYAAGKNNGYFFKYSSIENSEGYTPSLNRFMMINYNDKMEFDDFDVTRFNEGERSCLIGINNRDKIVYALNGYYFLGTKNSSSFRYTDQEVLDIFDAEAGLTDTNYTNYSYFLTKKFINYINPVFDLISNMYCETIDYKNDSIDHIIKALDYLKLSSIQYSEDAYIHMVENLTVLTDDKFICNKSNTNQLKLLSNLQNYAMHDSMILMYTDDTDHYSAISKFINLCGLMAENFAAMKVKNTKINNESIEEFIDNLNDINFEPSWEKEIRLNGTRNMYK